MNESKKKFAALSRVNHARLRDNNDTEKLLTNIIIEEGKIVQYKIRLSFSLSRSLLILLLLLTFSLSLFFSLLLFCLRGWCVPKENDNAHDYYAREEYDDDEEEE